MSEELSATFEAIFRWAHILTGITWIGLLFFFNWVNAAFVPTMDADTKRKVIPELVPRALFWFRWGAAWTWISGFLLMGLVFYHGKNMWTGPNAQWGWMPGLMVAITFPGVYIYDFLAKRVLRSPQIAFWLGWLILSALFYAYVTLITVEGVAVISYRGALIHIGAMLGSIMAFNGWYRIWPAQKRILSAIKGGTVPEASDVDLAGTRSRHNTYLAFPLVFAMINAHSALFAGDKPWVVPLVVLVGFCACWLCYRKSKNVPGW